MENGEKNRNIYESGGDSDTVYGPLLTRQLKVDRFFRKTGNKGIKRGDRGDGLDSQAFLEN